MTEKELQQMRAAQERIGDQISDIRDRRKSRPVTVEIPAAMVPYLLEQVRGLLEHDIYKYQSATAAGREKESRHWNRQIRLHRRAIEILLDTERNRC